MKNIFTICIFFGIVFLSVYVSTAQNETMVVEANIYAEVVPEDIISIEVPDYVFLGDVNEKESGNKVKVYINNTGNVDVEITPYLVNSGNKIFQNLYFQRRMSGNNSAVYRIGEFSFEIAKPSTLGGKRSDYFYMWLDLGEFMEDITYDMLGVREEILFVVLPKS